jgi:hypothetical protein
MAKRTLRDLYVVGKPLKIDDGQGPAIEVYVRKMNDVRHQEAMRRASAAKARAKSVLKDEASDEYQEILEMIQEFGREGNITYLIEDFRYGKEAAVEAELAAEDEWSTDGYLEGLRDAWIDGLDDEYAKDPEHTEAARVFAELKRFEQQAVKELEGRIEAFRTDLETKSNEQLEKMVVAKYAEVRAAHAWLAEFRRCEIWLSTFLPDKRTLAMEHRKDVDDLEPGVVATLMTEIESLSVDNQEGKDSPQSPTS